MSEYVKARDEAALEWNDSIIWSCDADINFKKGHDHCLTECPTVLKLVKMLKKQKMEWNCEIKEEWPDSPHETYLLCNVQDIDNVLNEYETACKEIKK